MRLLLIITSLLALIWSSYWIVFSVKLKSEVSDFIESHNSDQWVVDYSDLSIKGFPNRFDITLNKLYIRDNDLSVTWLLPYFQILSLSYKPNHLILVFPNTQTLENGNNKIIFNTTDMLASLSFMDYKFSELDQFILSIEKSELKGPKRKILNTTALNFAVKQNKTRNGNYHLGFRGNDIQLNLTEKNNFNFIFDVEMALKELNGLTNKKMPKISTVDIKALNLSSPNFNINGNGKASFNDNNIKDGVLNIKAKNWRSFFNTLFPENAKLRMGLDLIAPVTQNDETLHFSLKVDNGNIYLGPIFIGSLSNILE